MINPTLQEMLDYLNSKDGHRNQLTLRKVKCGWQARYYHSYKERRVSDDDHSEFGTTRGEAVLNIYEREVCSGLSDDKWFRENFIKEQNDG